MTCVTLNIKSLPSFCEFHSGKGIGTVAVRDELELFGQLCKSPECYTHDEDEGADTTVVRYLAADDGAVCCIRDRSDADSNVGFISGEHIHLFIRIMIDE